MPGTTFPRRDFIAAGGASLVTSVLAKGSKKMPGATKKPNLLFIYADQFRRQSLGFWSKKEYASALGSIGDPVQTPTLDRLADQGVVFTQAMSNHPVCSPFRGMMLSGMFPERNGIHDNCKVGHKDGLREESRCLTDVLKDSGYQTAYFGKTHWHRTERVFDKDGNYVGTTTPPGGHVVDEFDTYVPPGASRHSMDYWYQSLGNRHIRPIIYSNDPDTIEGKKDGEIHQPEIYSAENEANHIVHYFKEHLNKEEPFCILWAPNPPHNPYRHAPERYAKLYENEPIEKLLNRPNADKEVAGKHVKGYFSNVTALDDQIGRVLAQLEESGLADNTIVVFTSDHGDMIGSQGRMKKNVEFEESFGIPFIVRYPGTLKHRTDNLLFSAVDMMPTLLGLMGLSDQIPASVQGTDFSPLFRDGASGKVPRPQSALYFGAGPERRGIRTDKYTFVIGQDGVESLYNNIDDPYQMKNLSLSDIPENDRDMLASELGTWLKTAEDQWYKKRLHADLVDYPT